MKKGETKFQIRWGEHKNQSDYSLCIQLFSRGAINMNAQMKRIWEDEEDGNITFFPKNRWSVILWWLYTETITKKNIIIDGSAMMPFSYKTRRSALRKFKSLDTNIARANDHWRKIQDRLYWKKGDIVMKHKQN